jgi:hypothetical protein
VEGYCEHGNEPSGSIKCWEVLDNWTTGDYEKGANKSLAL